MEFSAFVLLLPVIILALQTHTASASLAGSLKCYECNSAFNDSCLASPPPEHFLQLCPESSTFCRTVQQWVDFEVLKQKPHKRIIRQCGMNNDSESSSKCYYKAGFGGRMNVCRCSGEGCNMAVVVGPGLALMALSILLVALNL